MSADRILAIDVGGGTQDILLYEKGTLWENSVKLILPAQTQIVAKRIARITQHGKTLFLKGKLMGGGACVGAIRNHIKAGLDAYATEPAAKTIKDNLAEVERMGVRIVSGVPEDAESIELGDIDVASLRDALGCFDTELPAIFAIAVQDHGECVEGSNRKFRFKHWKDFLENDGILSHLAYRTPPSYLTRMRAVVGDLPGSVVMDTCSAAIFGALCDPVTEQQKQKGVVIINIGNQHTVGALIKQEKVLGLFEHHTALMTPEKLKDHVHRLLKADLTNEEVFEDGGHGCFVNPDFSPGDGFTLVSVTGPRRSIAEDLGYHFAVPHGDMMLTGCFGLIRAANNLL